MPLNKGTKKEPNLETWTRIQVCEHLQFIFFLFSILVGDCSRGQPEGSLFNSYYTEV